LKSLYYPLFHSVLIYGIQIWPSASPSNFACLKLKQKAAVRIVLGTEHLNILPLHLMQHFIQDFLPDSFNNMWSLNAYRRNAESHIALRNDDVFDVPFARTSLTERQPLTRILNNPRVMLLSCWLPVQFSLFVLLNFICNPVIPTVSLPIDGNIYYVFYVSTAQILMVSDELFSPFRSAIHCLSDERLSDERKGKLKK